MDVRLRKWERYFEMVRAVSRAFWGVALSLNSGRRHGATDGVLPKVEPSWPAWMLTTIRG